VYRSAFIGVNDPGVTRHVGPDVLHFRQDHGRAAGATIVKPHSRHEVVEINKEYLPRALLGARDSRNQHRDTVV
jgi:hypothetical protein